MTSSLTGNRGFGSGPSGLAAGQKAAGYQQLSTPNFTPEQMQLFQQLFSHTGPNSYLSRLAGGDEAAFAEQEAPALRQFGALQGGIASRFSGAGSTGARRSSGFNIAQNQAASDFAQDLQARRMGLQRQALQDLFGMSHELLGQKPYEQALIPEQQPWWKELLSSLAGGAGGGLGSYLTGKFF